MDLKSLDYRLTAEERRQFEQEGYFIIPDALPASLVHDLGAVVDRLDRQSRQKHGIDSREMIHILDFIGRDDLFLRLLDWPLTFPKVWGILGWNIQLYHSDLVITPPRGVHSAEKRRLEWHQDSGRLNLELEGDPRPRVSLKIGFFLTDTSVPGCGNFTIVPGSHRRNRLDLPKGGVSDPEDALTVCVPPGAAVFFDRRLWHSGSPNDSDWTRKVLFYGYSFRWLRPRDDMTVDHVMDRCDPIRQQLLGASTGGMGYTSPGPEDVRSKPGWNDTCRRKKSPFSCSGRRQRKRKVGKRKAPSPAGLRRIHGRNKPSNQSGSRILNQIVFGRGARYA